ncbi:MAG: hypothetical protein RBT71_14225 [Flavobacteriales bacterium]|jgi:hypothetical protein|nr:hypothetical protein [Flavobacteriales bacterium]
MRRLLLLSLFAILFTGLELCDVERKHVCTDEHRPSLHGFPMVQRTSVPWVNSMTGVPYVDGTVVNVLCWVAALLSALWLLDRSSRWQALRIPQWLSWVALVPGLALLTLDLLIIDWRWEWSPHWDMVCFRSRWWVSGM